MFREFFDLRDELVERGEVFGPDSLALLAYPDLLRAAIGDAHSASCDLEAVQAEQRRRVDAYLGIITGPEVLYRLSDELSSQGMLEAVTNRMRDTTLECFTPWDELPATLRVYFRIQCLRAHVDNPRPRLIALLTEIDKLDVANHGEKSLLTIIRYGAEDLLKQLDVELITINRMRTKFKGYEHFLRGMTPREQATCLQSTIRDYTCSAGCFMPEMPEG